MNVEVYNLDSLRKLVRNLQDENRKLRELLDKADITFDSKNVFEEKIEKMRSTIPTREYASKENILPKNWQINILQCFGEEWMFVPKEVRKGDIFHSVITDGMTGYARNSEVKKSIVNPVSIRSGQNLSLKNYRAASWISRRRCMRQKRELSYPVQNLPCTG